MVLWPKTLQQVPNSNIEFSNVHNSAVLWAIFDEKEAPDRKSMSAIRWQGRKAFISDKHGPKLGQICFYSAPFSNRMGGLVLVLVLVSPEDSRRDSHGGVVAGAAGAAAVGEGSGQPRGAL